VTRVAIRLAVPQPSLWGPAAAAAARRVTWIELFFDLVFVAVVAQVGAPLAEHYTPAAVLRYAFLLFLTWWAWHGYAVYTTRFDASDRIQRATTLLQMVAVIFMAANAEGDLASESSAGFAAAYALMRLILVGEYARASGVPAARRLAREYATGYGVAAGLWLVSAIAPLSIRFWLWGLALAVDVGTAVITSRHATTLPPHAAHLPERFGLFTLILLGESIVAIVKGIQSQTDWSLAAALPAFAGIGLVFAMWWGYFDAASGAADRHVRTRQDARWLQVWSYAHLPLYLGVALVGVGIEHIVVTGGTAPLHHEEALVLCGATAIFAMALTVVGIASDRLVAAARTRLAAAAAIASIVILAMVPLAHFAMPGSIVGALAVTIALLAIAIARTHAAAGHTAH
jgi:low temperature requirement protein LtrA